MHYLHYKYSVIQPQKTALKLNTTSHSSITIDKSPVFEPSQRVVFIGGCGIIRNCTPEAGTWHYLIEMPMGAKPAFGRVGAETMLLLAEADLKAV